jgi:protein-glucosylgalactosylhydroxylysine glucosidase
MMDAPKNRYLPNGHNYQDDRLPLYLPGNGGLLAAVAMMAAGWDGAPPVEAPGFPKDGNWTVRYEGIHPIP